MSSSGTSSAGSSSHPFASVSSAWLDNAAFEQQVSRIFAEEQVSFGVGGIYTPWVTLAGWLWQSLHHASCRQAVLWLSLHLAPLAKAKAIETGNYCRARAKLPEKALRRLTSQTAVAAEAAVPESWRWKGRKVFLVDGTTASMPDTAANQAAYPQPQAQATGVGFPLMRVVVIFSLATAMVHDAAFGPYAGKETGETALLRQIFASLAQDAVLVADRYYCSYWMVALAQARGIDVVFRLHQLRNHDFRQGKRLGVNDREVLWHKPNCPEWMTAEEYATMPATLTLRMVRQRVLEPGFRLRRLTVVTTLSSQAYSTEAITGLFRGRWHAELDLRSIKSTMGMEILSCKTPTNVRREIWMRLLAYNLCRQQGGRAAWHAQRSPRAISLAACRQALQLEASQPPCFLRPWLPPRPAGGSALITMLGGETVGNRPHRCEPRDQAATQAAQTLDRAAPAGTGPALGRCGGYHLSDTVARKTSKGRTTPRINRSLACPRRAALPLRADLSTTVLRPK